MDSRHALELSNAPLQDQVGFWDLSFIIGFNFSLYSNKFLIFVFWCLIFEVRISHFHVIFFGSYQYIIINICTTFFILHPGVWIERKVYVCLQITLESLRMEVMTTVLMILISNYLYKAMGSDKTGKWLCWKPIDFLLAAQCRKDDVIDYLQERLGITHSSFRFFHRRESISTKSSICFAIPSPRSSFYSFHFPRFMLSLIVAAVVKNLKTISFYLQGRFMSGGLSHCDPRIKQWLSYSKFALALKKVCILFYFYSWRGLYGSSFRKLATHYCNEEQMKARTFFSKGRFIWHVNRSF